MDRFSPDKNESAQELPENIEVVDTPQAKFRLIYEDHRYTHSSAELGNPDALAIEMVARQDFGDLGAPFFAPSLFVDELVSRRPTDNAPDTASYIKVIKERKIPIYLIDIVDPQRTYANFGTAVLTLGLAATTTAGLAAVNYLREKIVSKKPPTRRDVLKGTVAAAVASKGAASISSLIADAKINPERITKPNALEKVVRRVDETINPEIHTLLISYRDAIWAHKLHTIARKLYESTGRKPEIAMQLGRAHTGLGTMLLADSEHRLDYIRKATAVINAILPLFNNGIRISSVGKIEFENGKWIRSEAYYDPDLEKFEP